MPVWEAVGNESASTFFLKSSVSAFEPGSTESHDAGPIGRCLRSGVQLQPAASRQIPAARTIGHNRPARRQPRSSQVILSIPGAVFDFEQYRSKTFGQNESSGLGGRPQSGSYGSRRGSPTQSFND